MNGFEDLVDHLQVPAGDTLQAVVVHRGNEHRDLYPRDDVVEWVAEVTGCEHQGRRFSESRLSAEPPGRPCVA